MTALSHGTCGRTCTKRRERAGPAKQQLPFSPVHTPLAAQHGIPANTNHCVRMSLRRPQKRPVSNLLAISWSARYALKASNNNHQNLLLNENLESRDVVRELKGCSHENSSWASKYSLWHIPSAIAEMTRVTKAPFSLL